jgi:hypothetical protein
LANGSSQAQYVATVMQLDASTGQYLPNYTINPTGPNMARFTLPVATGTGTTIQPETIVPKGMLYHPTFGIMVYGPYAETLVTQAQPFSASPDVELSNTA